MPFELDIEEIRRRFEKVGKFSRFDLTRNGKDYLSDRTQKVWQSILSTSRSQLDRKANANQRLAECRSAPSTRPNQIRRDVYINEVHFRLDVEELWYHEVIEMAGYAPGAQLQVEYVIPNAKAHLETTGRLMRGVKGYTHVRVVDGLCFTVRPYGYGSVLPSRDSTVD